ncbi:hypothetical protein GIY23_05065 [Allosaccharopolyspora coralli]|uniref:Uncharacterized protein n=1 Tax=Allosaccharopolyspora coralli TaxID=2665642 RepID=A0A5Q3Q317_9PSEU|nr:hypothetical protein [Allosaccharopolyspora coralli]QGK68988.1 hypothetical protein GIY23_05065 [Allosaccharopolyspora coralli]
MGGVDPHDPDPGATRHDFIGLFFAAWALPWFIGFLMIRAAIMGWLRRTGWVLLGLTGAMSTVSTATYLVGST